MSDLRCQVILGMRFSISWIFGRLVASCSKATLQIYVIRYLSHQSISIVSY